MHSLPVEGSVPREGWKVLRASSENAGNEKFAFHAIDGDPMTLWHTRFTGDTPAVYPHEIVIDMGQSRVVRGFRYLARQDNAWNGAVKDCEWYVGDDPAAFGEPVAKATLEKTRKPQETACPETKGRYVMFRALSGIVEDGPWASAAEIGVVGE
jgi:hypothetical protein